MSTITLPVHDAAPAAASAQAKSFWQKALAVWVSPYKNADDLLPLM